ncbi:MAG: UDP-N-acetylmuramoyl-tripeptide--D-alanyl-D-alanine ligase [Microgenomates bacterium OLB22]|nr:MAG: UDP-N-acetylmuramoyl-tripeptide--D-alanyl-D-alanine ligase [Microgenomates bacterium OLB22]
MPEYIKDILFFAVAWYFRIWTRIKLWRWHPQVIIVTGSSGKTTVIQLLKAQLGSKAAFADHANSAFGVPFDILGLHRVSYHWSEWISLVFCAPFAAFSPVSPHMRYIVEADADRPGEGQFLASLLRPSYVLWVSSARTHSLRFDPLVRSGKFRSVEEAIAYEFGFFLEYCSEKAWIVAENELMRLQIPRCPARVIQISNKELISYKVSTRGTTFSFAHAVYTLPYALPELVHYGLQMVEALLGELTSPLDSSWDRLSIPPGRNSLFSGIKDTTLIDSSYNANLSSMTVIIKMVDQIRHKNTWAVIGDMLEQGVTGPDQHRELGELLAATTFSRVIFFGENAKLYTKPAFDKDKKKKVESLWFETVKEVQDYLHKELQGKELILFKGGRYQEAVVESLLASAADKAHLCRREAIWVRKRKALGLVG